MTATERLRALLDERGVEYLENHFGITWDYYRNPHTADESKDGTLIVTGLTPEQAVAATLGPGTCELELNTDMTAVRCDACGHVMPPGTDLMGVNYCPNCGRKVVE